MEQTSLTIQLEAGKKEQFEALCEQFGSSTDTIFVQFVNTVIHNRSLPKEVVNNRLRELFEQHIQSLDPNEPEMTLEEINEEIRLARAERKARLAKMQQ